MSGFTTVQTLLEEAQNGRQLTTEERRRVIAYVMSSQPDVSNMDMARWFRVSEGSIRKDKTLLRQKMADEVKDDDIAMVIGDIVWSAKRQITDLEASKAKAAKGSATYVQHCKAIIEIQQNTVKTLQDLGFYPKNLGNMSIEKFEFAAVVSADGSVETRPMDLFDPETQKQVRARDQKSLPAPVVVEAEIIEDRKVEFAPPAAVPAQESDAATSNSSELSQSQSGTSEGR